MATTSKRSRSEAEYEDYDTTSQTYDTVRRCVGLDALERALLRSSEGVGKPLSELQLLDTGCGTGNYIAAVKDRLASCVGLDPNMGMIKQARTKLGVDPLVTLQEGSVLEIPFPDSSFDVVIMTQVLHHLTPDTHAMALSEIVRVLRPGGTFWISTQTPHQHMEGFWWAQLIPQAAASLAARFPGQPQFTAQLEAAGLTKVVWEVPDETLIAPEAYLDVEGPFSEIYRNGDSTWSLATEAELSAGLAWWKQEIDAGRGKAFLAAREQRRKDVGQTSAVCAQKPRHLG